MKNYGLYLKKLLRFALALGITVSRRPLQEHEGWYEPKSHSIVMDDDLDDEDTIAILLHELGHAVDEYRIERLNQPIRMKAYGAVYDDTATKLQTKMVLEDEKVAWKIGRLIAKQLKIPLGKWYKRNERDGMWVYKHWNRK